MRSRRKRQPQRHARAVNHLPCMEVERPAEQRQAVIHQRQHLGRAAGKMHCQQIARRHAAIHLRGFHMPALVRRSKTGNAKQSRQTAALCVPCLKHGHIRRFLIPWTAGSAHRDDFAIRQIRRQFLNQPRHLTDMREHRLRLPQPALSLWNRQQLAAARNHIALRGYGSSGRGVAACVKPDNDALHGFSACFLRRIVPSTPLTKRPLVGSEKRLARLTASLMATGPGIPSS